MGYTVWPKRYVTAFDYDAQFLENFRRPQNGQNISPCVGKLQSQLEKREEVPTFPYKTSYLSWMTPDLEMLFINGKISQYVKMYFRDRN